METGTHPVCTQFARIEQIDCELKLILKERDISHPTSKSFKHDARNRGWSTDVCMSADIMKLSTFTFGVEIKVLAVYNKDGDDITESYNTKTVKPMSSVLSSNITDSIQSLTARMDSLTAAMEKVQNSIIAIQTRLDEEQKEDTNNVQQQIDIDCQIGCNGG